MILFHALVYYIYTVFQKESIYFFQSVTVCRNLQKSVYKMIVFYITFREFYKKKTFNNCTVLETSEMKHFSLPSYFSINSFALEQRNNFIHLTFAGAFHVLRR